VNALIVILSLLLALAWTVLLARIICPLTGRLFPRRDMTIPEADVEPISPWLAEVRRRRAERIQRAERIARI